MFKDKAPTFGCVLSMHSMKVLKVEHPLQKVTPTCLKMTRRLMNWRKRPMQHLLKHSTKTSTISFHIARPRKHCGMP
ncbi:hypothetical protein HanIR_Chr12g0603431 [Helianthus annuus]|nr:hypothetical protein HanIR_Chr12g0603431 [Helianthus annuus]